MGHKVITASVKAEAVGLVLNQGYSISEACELMNVGPTALRRWIVRWQATTALLAPAPGAVLTPEQERIKELEGQVRTLQQERELLKKSVAFFVRENGPSCK